MTAVIRFPLRHAFNDQLRLYLAASRFDFVHTTDIGGANESSIVIASGSRTNAVRSP
jgi:hypothetical protein